MIRHDYNLKDLSGIYGLPSDFFDFEDIIIDNETGNHMKDKKGTWHYDKADVICCGMLYGNQATILMRETKEQDNEMLAQIKDFIEKNLKSGNKLYAFNTLMEQGNFKGLFGTEYPFNEIKPFKAKKSKEWFYTQVLQKHRTVLKTRFDDPFADTAIRVIEAWNKYHSSGQDNHYLVDIIKHNLACLLKERVILKFREMFTDGQKYPVDKNGWLK